MNGTIDKIRIKNAPITIVEMPMWYCDKKFGTIKYVKIFGIVVLKKAKID